MRLLLTKQIKKLPYCVVSQMSTDHMDTNKRTDGHGNSKEEARAYENTLALGFG